jgi:hypothetical protein
MPKKGYKMPEEQKKKHALVGENNPNYGKKLSDEQKKKISDTLKELYKDKNNHPKYGKKLTEEQRKHLSDAHKGIQEGKNNPAWKGGVSSLRNRYHKDPRWKEVSKRIWQRDEATCQYCGKYKDRNQEFHIHHVVPFADERLRYEEFNLVLLCKECHISYIHTKKNKERMFIDPFSLNVVLLYRILKRVEALVYDKS